MHGDDWTQLGSWGVWTPESAELPLGNVTMHCCPHHSWQRGSRPAHPVWNLRHGMQKNYIGLRGRSMFEAILSLWMNSFVHLLEVTNMENACSEFWVHVKSINLLESKCLINNFKWHHTLTSFLFSPLPFCPFYTLYLWIQPLYHLLLPAPMPLKLAWPFSFLCCHEYSLRLANWQTAAQSAVMMSH